MTKYHINPETGNPGVCKATKQCRFGDASEHYSSRDEAEKAFESSMLNSLPEMFKKAVTPDDVELKYEYDFPAWRLTEAINRIEKANRRAERAGIQERFGYEIEKYEVRETDKSGLTVVNERAKLTLDRPSVQHDGWSFSGTMSWDAEAGLITRMVPGADLIQKPEAEFCDVCKTTRHRNDTYIVQKDGEQKQVGSNCLKRFMGIKPAGLWMLDFELDDNEGYDESPLSNGNPRDERRDSSEIMALGLAVVEAKGWISRSFAQETGKNATADDVITALTFEPKKASERAARDALLARGKELKKEAEEILKEAREIEGDTEYAQNMRALAKGDSVAIRNMPLLLSAIAVKKRKEAQLVTAKAKAKSTWVGKEGEKLEPRRVTVESVKVMGGSGYGYGSAPSKLVTMTDTDGNVYKSFYSGSSDIKEGKTYDLASSTVKKHQEWNGAKETMVGRIKLESVRPDIKPASKLPSASAFHEAWTPEEADKVSNAENRRIKKEFKKKAGKDGWDKVWDRPIDTALISEWNEQQRLIADEYSQRYGELTQD